MTTTESHVKGLTGVTMTQEDERGLFRSHRLRDIVRGIAKAYPVYLSLSAKPQIWAPGLGRSK